MSKENKTIHFIFLTVIFSFIQVVCIVGSLVVIASLGYMISDQRYKTYQHKDKLHYLSDESLEQIEEFKKQLIQKEINQREQSSK